MAYYLQNPAFRDSLLNDDRDSEVFGRDNSESEEDHLSEMSESSNFASSDEDMEVEDVTENERVLASRARGRPEPASTLKGKNGFVWHINVPARGSDQFRDAEDISIPGPKGEASNCEELAEFWNILFNEEIFQIIVEHTNNEIDQTCLQMIAEGQSLQTYHHHTDVKEIKAFVGILYYAGLWKSHNVETHDLWHKKNGITFYRCVMPRARFMFLSVCLRFDNEITRERMDRFAPIRQIWEIFIGNCSRYYEPHACCTVDEQLLGFRGRCLFRMYIKSKRDKYGLKIVTLNDAETSYLIHAIPHLGKTRTETDKDEPISEYFFRKVTTPIHGTNRTVTCDNWFTSVPLMQRMLQPPFGMTITGTIRKNKREIPQEMKVASKDPPNTKFCFTKEILLLSYTPKKNNIVLVASSYLNTTTTITKDKPDVILYYNATKGGMDCFDQLCRSYTTSRVTRRWPMRMFFGILDQAIVNAQILHKFKYRNNQQRKSLTARQCLEKIVFHLVEPYLLERYEQPSLYSDTRKVIAGILMRNGVEAPRRESERIYLDHRTRCGLCPRQEDRKTKQLCESCNRAMCDNHRIYMCVECGGTE